MSPRSYKLLDQIASLMENNPKLPRVQIAGHTDDVGDADKNLKLSAARAESVRKYLIAAGVNQSRLVARGYGESSPLVRGTTSAARAKNRRVDFVILRPFSISANVGFVISMPSGLENTEGTTGFIIGSAIQFPLSDSLELQVALNYLTRNAKTDANIEAQTGPNPAGARQAEAKYDVGYWEIPVTSHYLLPTIGGTINPYAGGGFSLGFASNARVNNTDAEAVSTLTSLVIETGATYEAPFGLMRAQLRYSAALNPTLEANDDFKISTIDFQVGYVF